MRQALVTILLFAASVVGISAISSFAFPAANGAEAAAAEVIAVADITAKANCEETWEVYRDEARTDLVESTKSTCSEGSVLHSKRMSADEARQQGLRHIVITGDRVADQSRLDALKAEMGPQAARGDQQVDARGAQTISLRTSTACIQSFYVKSLIYNTPNLDPGSDPGGRVRTYIHYKDKLGDCDRLIVTFTSIRFIVAPNPGNDLFWDRQMYSTSYDPTSPWYLVQRDARCKEIFTFPSQVIGDDWELVDDRWWIDETINDESAGCDWWGEEFTGAVQLLTY